MLTLLESRTIPAAYRRPGSEIQVHEAFRIFGTRTIVDSMSAAGSGRYDVSEFVVHAMKHFSFLWHFVTMAVPHSDEITIILQSRFPKLLPVVISKLIATYDILSGSSQFPVEGGQTLSPTLKTRRFTLRDLVKAADRICVNIADTFNWSSGRLTEAQSRCCVVELVDVYVASAREKNCFLSTCIVIGNCWNVSQADIETYLFNSQPQLHSQRERNGFSDEVGADSISIGRVTLTGGCSQTTSQETRPTVEVFNQQFAYTKYSLRLLEQVAVCVKMNESVLLVGETGSGKTTSVQQLATLLGKKLIVQNISLSTDSNELLGGYRPVSMRVLLLPIYEKFVSLFLDTFEGSQNKEYLQVCLGLRFDFQEFNA